MNSQGYLSMIGLVSMPCYVSRSEKSSEDERQHQISRLAQKWWQPQNEEVHKNEDKPKNYNKPQNGEKGRQ